MTQSETARVEPLALRLVPGMGLDWVPWIAIGRGATAENGLGASSVVLIGETAVADWSDDALSGLIAHEFAHVVLGHGRLSPSVALPTIAFRATRWRGCWNGPVRRTGRPRIRLGTPSEMQGSC